MLVVKPVCGVAAVFFLEGQCINEEFIRSWL